LPKGRSTLTSLRAGYRPVWLVFPFPGRFFAHSFAWVSGKYKSVSKSAKTYGGNWKRLLRHAGVPEFNPPYTIVK